MTEASATLWEDLGFEETPQVEETTPTNRSTAASIGRGAVSALSGLLEGSKIASPFQFQYIGDLLGIDIPSQGKMLEEITQVTPTSPLEKGLKRGGEAAGGAIALGAGPAVAGLAGAGGLLGQAAEEAGLPEWAQLGAEFLPIVASPLASARVLPSKGQKSLVEGARRLGLTEKEIAPLVRGKRANSFARSFLAKPSTREKIVARTEKGVVRALDRSNEAVNKIGVVTPDVRTGLLDKLETIAGRGETQVGTTSRSGRGTKFIRKEMRKIGRKEDLTGSDLRRFYRSANKEFGSSLPEPIRQSQEAIMEAIQKASPEAAKEFRTGNALYQRLKAIEGGPSRGAEYLDRAELWGLVTAIAAGKPGLGVKGWLSSEALRRAFTHTVSGPRGQRLVQKMLKASSEGKGALAQAAAKRLLKEVEETQNQDWEEFGFEEEEVSQ